MKKELTYKYTKAQNKQVAFSLAKSVLKEAENNGSFPVSVNFSVDDDFFIISGKGKGFEVKLSFEEHDLDISMDLSFVLKPLKGKILSKIEQELSRRI